MRYFMCPTCCEVYESQVDIKYLNINKEPNIVTSSQLFYKCKCGDYGVEIDKGLIDIIQKLNYIGLTTQFCCEGHLESLLYKEYGKEIYNIRAYIYFAPSINNDILLNIVKKHPLPDNWNIENNDIVDTDGAIISFEDTVRFNRTLKNLEFERRKKSYLKSLDNWVNELVKETINELSMFNNF